MEYEVTENFILKTSVGDIELSKGQYIKIQPWKVVKLVATGKIKPLVQPADREALNERMAIMGENTTPEQIKPYVTSFGVLIIPWNSDPRYHYWKGGQSLCDTLKELGRCDLIEKYKSIYN